MTSILLASLLASVTQMISGEIPPGLTAPARVIFVTADDSPGDVRCDEHARRWSCAGVTPGVRGLVVFVGDDGVASISIGMPDVDLALLLPSPTADVDQAARALTAVSATTPVASG